MVRSILDTNHTVFRYQTQTVNIFLFLIKFFFLFQDEVLAISDKVVIRANDLLTWMDRGSNWTCGLQASSNKSSDTPSIPSLKNTQLDFSDVNYEKGMSAMCFCYKFNFITSFHRKNMYIEKKKLCDICVWIRTHIWRG